MFSSEYPDDRSCIVLFGLRVGSGFTAGPRHKIPVTDDNAEREVSGIRTARFPLRYVMLVFSGQPDDFAVYDLSQLEDVARLRLVQEVGLVCHVFFGIEGLGRSVEMRRLSIEVGAEAAVSFPEAAYRRFDGVWCLEGANVAVLYFPGRATKP